IHQVIAPDPSVTLFGLKLAAPILIAPMAGMKYNLGRGISEAEVVQALVNGAKQAGVMVMTGDGIDPIEFSTGLQTCTTAAWGFPVLKPWSLAKLQQLIRSCELARMPGVGIDLDGIGLNSSGESEFTPKTKAELATLIQATKLPVFLKGILSVEDAELALQAGAAGIIVSNHGGRVLDGVSGTAAVLPAIIRQVKGRLPVLVDGGVRTGADVLKLLALGAKAVLVGRPLLIAAVGGGAAGVSLMLKGLQEDLKQAMLLTGCGSVADITADVLEDPPN
ncbi:MAG TPA: alpha-hydroxy-acid oxidizing protein, partial [Bacillota bacterium]